MKSSSKYTSILSGIEESIGKFSGKRILDLGSDLRGEAVSALCENFGVVEAMGVNAAIKKPISGNGWSVSNVDARDLPFQDETFDHIISLAAFEHFDGLDASLKEAHRVLRKGGSLISIFGPIWSGCWGHHLWVRDGAKRYTYQNMNLPPWAHLLMSRSEMRAWLNAQYEVAIAEKILSFVYDPSGQNRLFFNQYEDLFVNSDFKVLQFSGSTNQKKRNRYDSADLEAAFNRVGKEFPNHHGFEYDSIKVILAKN